MVAMKLEENMLWTLFMPWSTSVCAFLFPFQFQSTYSMYDVYFILSWHYMKTFYDDITRWYYTVTLHDDMKWWHYTMTLHDDIKWWYYTMPLHDDITWRLYMMALHDYFSRWHDRTTLHIDIIWWHYTMTMHYIITLHVHFERWRCTMSLRDNSTYIINGNEYGIYLIFHKNALIMVMMR